MVTTTIPTIGLKLNFLVRVLIANFVYVIFFLEDIQDPENPNDTKINHIEEVKAYFIHLTTL